MIILIVGSSASGKSTIGKLLAQQYKYIHIDGDQVIKDLGLRSKYWNSIHEKLIAQAITKATNSNVVISHVVPPDKLKLYREEFNKRKNDYRIIILKPTKRILVERNISRTCHPKPTPLDVIEYFYKMFDVDVPGCYVIDNSNMSEQKTLLEILKLSMIERD